MNHVEKSNNVTFYVPHGLHIDLNIGFKMVYKPLQSTEVSFVMLD